MSHYVGVDLGGTTTTIAIGNENREVSYVSPQFDTSPVQGPSKAIDGIVCAIADGIRSIGASFQTVKRIGISTPGPATRDGVLLNPPNLNSLSWSNFPIRASLENAVSIYAPEAIVYYIGDGQAAALGEYFIRTGALAWNRVTGIDTEFEGLTSLFMVIVGTGLGGGHILNGCPIRGIRGHAGHAGHIFLPDYAFRYEYDRQLLIGNSTSTLESAVSISALAHQLGYRLQLDQWQEHPLNSLESSLLEKAKHLRELAAQGDALALEMFDDQARALGIGLLAVNYIGDHDLLVIGGGVCDLAPEIRRQYQLTAKNAYQNFALDGFRNLGNIEFSICGDDAAVIGALAVAYS